MTLKQFIFSKVFAKNIGLAFAIITVLVIIILIWLNIYTRHGQSRPVPDFYGLSLDETAALAKKYKMRFEVVDSVYTSIVPEGRVAEQNPGPEVKVKKWRRIAVIINAFNPEMVTVPNLVGLPLRQANLVIESAGLKTGQLRYIPDLSIDFVIRQLHNGIEVPEGDSLQKGSVIDLVLGKGLSNERTPVPNLIGYKLERAKNGILGASLNLGTYIYDNSIQTEEDTLNAFVFKQNPEYKEESTLQLGSNIYLWLTIDSAKLPVDTSLIMLSDTVNLEAVIRALQNR